MANTTDKSILTAAGKALLAQLNAEEKPLIIDKMIFANMPNRPEYPQPDDVVPTDHVVHQEGVEQRGRLTADSVIYSTTLTSGVGPFEFNWTGAYCSEHGVLVTIDHHALTPKTADEPGVAGNTLVRSVVLEYKDIAEITNITVDASSWQYNATPRMKKMDDDVAQAIIDQNGKDWFIEDGFLVTPQASAFNIKAGAGYVSGNRVTLEFDRSVQVPNKPSFIYVDAHREGTPTGEQVTLFDFVITAEEKDDYTDANGVKHFVCKIAQVHADGSVSDLRPESPIDKRWETGKQVKANKDQYLYLGTEQCVYGKKWYAPRASGEHVVVMGRSPLDNGEFREVETGALALSIGDSKEIAIPEGVNCTLVDNVLLYQWDDFSNESHTIQSVSANAFKGYDVVTDKGTFEFVSKAVMDLRGGSTKLSNRVNSVLSGWGNLGTVAQNTLTLQNAINNSNKITILEPVAVYQINLKSDFELHFAGAGKLIGQSGSKVIYAESVTNTKVNNPVIEGVYDGDTSNLAEHAIEFKYSSDIEINNPKGRNIGGCFIRLEECTDILTRNVDAELVGYLAYIAVDCVRAKLKGGRGSKIDDPYAFQSKGGASDEI
ncbi:phage tail protein, partial [Vibrio vulnificus]